MSTIKYFMKIKYVKATQWKAIARDRYLILTSRLQCRGLKTTKVEACVALVCASTGNSRLLTGGPNLIRTVVDWIASGRTFHKWHPAI